MADPSPACSMSSLPVYNEEYPLHTEVCWLVHAVLTKRGQGQKKNNIICFFNHCTVKASTVQYACFIHTHFTILQYTVMQTCRV